MKGIGPVDDWLKQDEKFIPYNMKNYQQRLLQLLRRIQTYGVESFVFQKKPYLYTGSWMEYVRNLDDLMLQINGCSSNEASMKVFNVLFPYPDPLPIGQGDESSLAGFFDGVTNVDKKKESRDCMPDQLLENLNAKRSNIAEDAMANNNVETVQDLLDIRQEVMQLRSANNALEFQIAQKDEMIAQLKGDAEGWKKKYGQSSENNAENMKLLAENVQLQNQNRLLTDQNSQLEDRVAQLEAALSKAEANAGSSNLTEMQKQMAQ